MMQYLKCDADGCDHRERVEEYGEHLVGKPCPKCGSSLLTQDDYTESLAIIAAMNFLESLGVVKTAPMGEGDININIHNGELRIKAVEK